MARGFSDCCHYDDGYDDGYKDGRDEASPENMLELLADGLRLLARERWLAGAVDECELLEALADGVMSDAGLIARVEGEKKRREKVAEMYAESRKAAAA